MNAEKPTSAASAIDEPRYRVLVVDDEASVLESIEAVLSTEFDVESVADVDLAEAALRAKSFDVVITDYLLPKRTGLELLDLIAHEFPTVMGILLSGYAEMPQVQAARRDRKIFYVLTKPSDPASLLQWTRSAARSARLRDTMARLKERVDKTASPREPR